MASCVEGQLLLFAITRVDGICGNSRQCRRRASSCFLSLASGTSADDAFSFLGESLSSLVGLLAHENTDIAIGAIEIISELLDEDVETGKSTIPPLFTQRSELLASDCAA